MKNRKYTNLTILSLLILALVLTIEPSIKGQTNNSNDVEQPLQNQAIDGNISMERQRHQLMEDMRTQDIELTKAVATMNKAPHDKKMALMAAIITQMVEQRSDMNSRMLEMQERVTQYMLAMKGLSNKSVNSTKDQK